MVWFEELQRTRRGRNSSRAQACGFTIVDLRAAGIPIAGVPITNVPTDYAGAQYVAASSVPYYNFQQQPAAAYQTITTQPGSVRHILNLARFFSTATWYFSGDSLNHYR